MTPLHRDEPRIVGPLPGPRSAAWLERDDRVMSPSYTRAYPAGRPRGTRGDDRGHGRQPLPRLHGRDRRDRRRALAIPRVVAAIRKQAGRLIHMSGTDFYYAPQVRLAERLAALAPGPGPEAGLLHQQRRRGDRGRPEAGAAAHRPATARWRS